MLKNRKLVEYNSVIFDSDNQYSIIGQSTIDKDNNVKYANTLSDNILFLVTDIVSILLIIFSTWLIIIDLLYQYPFRLGSNIVLDSFLTLVCFNLLMGYLSQGFIKISKVIQFRSSIVNIENDYECIADKDRFLIIKPLTEITMQNLIKVYSKYRKLIDYICNRKYNILLIIIIYQLSLMSVMFNIKTSHIRFLPDIILLLIISILFILLQTRSKKKKDIDLFISERFMRFNYLKLFSCKSNEDPNSQNDKATALINIKSNNFKQSTLIDLKNSLIMTGSASVDNDLNVVFTESSKNEYSNLIVYWLIKSLGFVLVIIGIYFHVFKGYFSSFNGNNVIGFLIECLMVTISLPLPYFKLWSSFKSKIELRAKDVIENKDKLYIGSEFYGLLVDKFKSTEESRSNDIPCIDKLLLSFSKSVFIDLSLPFVASIINWFIYNMFYLGKGTTDLFLFRILILCSVPLIIVFYIENIKRGLVKDLINQRLKR